MSIVRQKALNNGPGNVRLWNSESNFIVCRYTYSTEKKVNTGKRAIEKNAARQQGANSFLFNNIRADWNVWFSLKKKHETFESIEGTESM